jgi:hypothetical protein
MYAKANGACDSRDLSASFGEGPRDERDSELGTVDELEEPPMPTSQSKSKPKRERNLWNVVLEILPTEDGVPEINRMKRALKCLLRAYKIRCIRILQDPPDELPENAAEPDPA